MGVSLFLCLLTALLATASVQAQLKCLQCPPTENTCPSTGEATPCSSPPEKSGCISVAEENTLDGTTAFKGFSRGCITDFKNNQKVDLMVTTGMGKYMRISAKQCQGDKCNTDPLTVPQVEASSNGLQCPSCQAVGTSTCIPETIACKGKEIFCVSLAGNFKKGADTPAINFVALGCANSAANEIANSFPWQLGMFTFTEGKVKKAESIPTQPSPQSTPKPTTATTSGANPAPGQVPFTLFLPGLTGLLLVKLLS